jgi:hypothetical protein
VYGHDMHLIQHSSPSFHPHLAGQKFQNHLVHNRIRANDLRCPGSGSTSTSNHDSDIAENKDAQSTDHEEVDWSGYTNYH